MRLAPSMTPTPAGMGSLMSEHYAAPPVRAAPSTAQLSDAGLMHDLGNLLQVIASANREIERRIDGRSYDDIIWLARTSVLAVGRATDLRARMLNSPGTRPGQEVTSLEASIAAISELIVLAAGPDVIVRFVTVPDVPSILCNRQELENTILNLVSNARDSMPNGGVLTVSLGIKPAGLRDSAGTEDECSDALLCLSDTGRGMAPEIVDAAFDPFFTTKVDGHGLGLAMVQAFARSTGGSAGIDSVVGHGTVITLRLPGRSGQQQAMTSRNSPSYEAFND